MNVRLVAALTLWCGFAAGSSFAQSSLSPKEQLGKEIFNDVALSKNGNQACASCHAPSVGFTGPNDAFNAHGAVHEGSVSGSFGARKPPSAAYATLSPAFHQDPSGLFVGGNFWDGRATGAGLGSPSADQAKGPFLNPLEQALPSAAHVVNRVCSGPYSRQFVKVWGTRACSSVTGAFDKIALSIAAFEDSSEVNAFSSRFDKAGRENRGLTALERKGRQLFDGKGKCGLCHVSTGKSPAFTDFTFDNLGLPKNPENPVYAQDPSFIDPGLGGALKSAGQPSEVYDAEWGKHKVPTLRNVDARPYDAFVKAYGHNGYFKTLEGLVHFYNTRDVLPACPEPDGVPYTERDAMSAQCWPAPEYPDTMNRSELGDLGLSPYEESAIVAFLKTLTDSRPRR